MSKKFFTSDLHFGHYNILKYENRPFASIDEMDDTLIDNWNKVVSKNDEVYILGDVSFHRDPKVTKSILRELSGRKYLILGNHDKEIVHSEELRREFVWVKDYATLRMGDTKVVLFHYPIQTWDCQHHGAIHLYGHIHSNISSHAMKYEIPNSYNVGVDVNDYRPISFEEIMQRI